MKPDNGSIDDLKAMGHWQKKNLPSSVLLLVWPGEVRRKREDDSGQTGPALFAGSNKTELGNFFFCRCPIDWKSHKGKCKFRPKNLG